MRVLGIAGSLRSGSHNRELLRLAAAALPDGVELEIWEGLRNIPAFDEDGEDPAPAAVTALRAAVGAADAVLIVTPEYNGSIPGQLKNALDWASRPFPDNALWGKTAAVIGASTGAYGAVWAQAELRKVLGAIGARVIESGVAVTRASERFDANGRLVDARSRASLAGVLHELTATAQPVGARAA